MNNQEKYNEDRLKQYINHETIEKAPDEFTSKVMARIRTEVVTEKEAGRLRNRNLVPVISAGITIILLVAAFLITGNKADSSTLQVTDLIKNLKVTFSEHDFAFIIIPGNDVDSNRNVEKEIASASAKIQNEGIIVDTISLDKQNPEYSITIDRMVIARLPAVFAIASNGYGMIIVGDITETKLLQAFLTAAKACPPGSSSGCCP